MFEGYMAVRKIYKEKKKHLWADQVLNELLKHTTMYDKKDRVLRPGQQQKSGISDEGSDEDLTEDSEEEFEDDNSASSRMEQSSFSGMNPVNSWLKIANTHNDLTICFIFRAQLIHI